jgi:hypothetical protein
MSKHKHVEKPKIASKVLTIAAVAIVTFALGFGCRKPAKPSLPDPIVVTNTVTLTNIITATNLVTSLVTVTNTIVKADLVTHVRNITNETTLYKYVSVTNSVVPKTSPWWAYRPHTNPPPKKMYPVLIKE